MSSIFVAYRRGDTKWITGRVFEHLQRHFGKSSVFMDIETMVPGVDFRKHIEEVLHHCTVVVAVVGPGWRGADGAQARIFDPNDWVRIEIETAFKRGIPVIPVRVDGAPFPRPQELPESIREFAYLQGSDLDSGRDFNIHMRRLIGAIERRLGWRALTRKYRWWAASAFVILNTAAIAIRLSEEPGPQTRNEQSAIQACNAAFTLSCAQKGGAFGAAEALAGLRNCKIAQINSSDEMSLRWKDIWTTSVYSYAPAGGGPGGGKDDDVLKVGGWGDWYFTLIQFDLPPLSKRPQFAALALYSKESEGASVPLALDRIINRWDFPKGGTLWWANRPGHRAVTTESLPAPRKEQWYIIELTALVQEWFEGKSENYGIQIRPAHDFGSFVFFVSSDATDKTKIPRLIFCT